MLAYLFLGLSAALLIFAGITFIPEILLIHYVISAGVILLFYVVAFKVMYPALYPLKVKIYGMRFNSFVVYKDTRGRVTKDKKGFEFIELPGGKKIKMPDRNNFVKGTGKEAHADMLEYESQYFPISLNSMKAVDIAKFIIPENQRVWFAKRLIPDIKEATRPPRDKWMQISMMVIPIAIVLMLAIFMILYPPYFNEMDAQMKKIADAKQAKLQSDWSELQRMYDSGIIVCDCGSGKTTQVGSNATIPIRPPG